MNFQFKVFNAVYSKFKWLSINCILTYGFLIHSILSFLNKSWSQTYISSKTFLIMWPLGLLLRISKGKLSTSTNSQKRNLDTRKKNWSARQLMCLCRQKSTRCTTSTVKVFISTPSREEWERAGIFSRKKRWDRIPVEISLSNYEINGEIFVIAFVIDITVRKKNEAVVLEQKDELERITAQI